MIITLLIIIAIYVAYELNGHTPAVGPPSAEHTTLDPDELDQLTEIEIHLTHTDPELAQKLRRQT